MPDPGAGYVVGIDFGTLSARRGRVRDGEILGSAVHEYADAVIIAPPRHRDRAAPRLGAAESGRLDRGAATCGAAGARGQRYRPGRT
jgi:hypothetical protein